jgi:hypothetical protein
MPKESPSVGTIPLCVRERFCRDYHLPINVKTDPHFKHFLDLYNPLFRTREKWANLCDFYQKQGGSEEAFFQKMKSIRERVQDKITGQKVYEYLINDSLDGFVDGLKSFAPHVTVNKKTVYNPEDAGSYYISLDMRKANFASMQFYSTLLVLNANTYEEMIQKFEAHPYVVYSRGLRQVIFGQLSPKKQKTIQSFLTSRIYQAISDIFPYETIINVSQDEVVLRAREKTLREDLAKVKNRLSSWPFVRTEAFYLRELKGHRAEGSHFFVKEFLDKSIRFKGIPSYFLAQCYRKYNNEEIHPYDLLFRFEGHLAQFKKTLFPMVQ